MLVCYSMLYEYEYTHTHTHGEDICIMPRNWSNTCKYVASVFEYVYETVHPRGKHRLLFWYGLTMIEHFMHNLFKGQVSNTFERDE